MLLSPPPSPLPGRPPPSPLHMCVVGCVCAAVGASACRRVGLCVGVGEIGNRPYPNIPVFLEKVIIYRGAPPHTRTTFTWYDGFFVGGFWSFFSFFLGYDVRACPATGPAKLDSGLKTRLAAEPKAEDTARPGRNPGVRLARPPGPPAWPRLNRSPTWP